MLMCQKNHTYLITEYGRVGSDLQHMVCRGTVDQFSSADFHKALTMCSRHRDCESQTCLPLPDTEETVEEAGSSRSHCVKR